MVSIEVMRGEGYINFAIYKIELKTCVDLCQNYSIIYIQFDQFESILFNT